MGIIIPALVACACPRGFSTVPPFDGPLVLTRGAWELETDDEDERTRFRAWAETACPHGLIQAEAWPLLSMLQNLAAFLRRVDLPDARALVGLVAAFARLPDEAGSLDRITFAVDERHRRALAAVPAQLGDYEGAYLVDSDTGAVAAGPSTMNAPPAGPVTRGGVFIRSAPPPPFYSRPAHFDADGFRVERDGRIVFEARRVTQQSNGATTRLTDRDTGVSLVVDGAVGYGSPRDWIEPRAFHVELRRLPADYFDVIREELTGLTEAARSTGHPILLHDRFGGLSI